MPTSLMIIPTIPGSSVIGMNTTTVVVVEARMEAPTSSAPALIDPITPSSPAL